MMLDFQGKAEGYGCLVASHKLITPHFEALLHTSLQYRPEEEQREEPTIQTDV